MRADARRYRRSAAAMAALAGAVALGACQSDETMTASGPSSTVITGAGRTTTKGPAGRPTVEVKKLPRAGEATEFELEYPVLTYPGRQDVADRVNSAVLAAVDKAVTEFEREAGDENGKPLTTVSSQPNSLSVTYETVRLDAKVASFRADWSRYLSGAAHPGSSIVTQTFDLDTGEPVALADLFQPGAPYLDTLSTLCATRVVETFKQSQDGQALDDSGLMWVREGTAPTDENFAAWAVVPEGLEVTFQEYQVGPYALGPMRCDLPRAELASVSRSGGLL